MLTRLQLCWNQRSWCSRAQVKEWTYGQIKSSTWNVVGNKVGNAIVGPTNEQVTQLVHGWISADFGIRRR